MAYANSTLFYGWSEADAVKIIRDLTSKDIKSIKIKSGDVEDAENVLEPINTSLHQISPDLNVSVFFGGCGSKSRVLYLRLGDVLTNQSCDSDDISEKSFTIKQLQDFLNLSFALDKQSKLSKPPVKLSKPRLIHLTVSDEK